MAEHEESPESTNPKDQCIFCHIISGRIPSKKIFEDDKVVAILDIKPATQGHILLLPKEHYAIMPQIPEELIAHMGMIAKGLSQASIQAFQCQGTNIIIANGAAAGQRAPHVMFHIMPRMEGDSVSFDVPGLALDSASELTIMQKIGPIVAAALKLPPTHMTVTKPETGAKKTEHSPPPPAPQSPPTKSGPSKDSGSSLDDIADFLGGKK